MQHPIPQCLPLKRLPTVLKHLPTPVTVMPGSAPSVPSSRSSDFMDDRECSDVLFNKLLCRYPIAVDKKAPSTNSVRAIIMAELSHCGSDAWRDRNYAATIKRVQSRWTYQQIKQQFDHILLNSTLKGMDKDDIQDHIQQEYPRISGRNGNVKLVNKLYRKVSTL